MNVISVNHNETINNALWVKRMFHGDQRIQIKDGLKNQFPMLYHDTQECVLMLGLSIFFHPGNAKFAIGQKILAHIRWR